MTDVPTVVHRAAHAAADNTNVRTLCGLLGHVSEKQTRQVKQGPWVSCPLCELAAALADENAVDHTEGAESWT